MPGCVLQRVHLPEALHGVLALDEHLGPSLEVAQCSSKQKSSPGASWGNTGGGCKLKKPFAPNIFVSFGVAKPLKSIIQALGPGTLGPGQSLLDGSNRSGALPIVLGLPGLNPQTPSHWSPWLSRQQRFIPGFLSWCSEIPPAPHPRILHFGPRLSLCCLVITN